jgi:hypothetical protein
VNDFANLPLFATNAPTNEITIPIASSAMCRGSMASSIGTSGI